MNARMHDRCWTIQTAWGQVRIDAGYPRERDGSEAAKAGRASALSALRYELDSSPRALAVLREAFSLLGGGVIAPPRGRRDDEAYSSERHELERRLLDEVTARRIELTLIVPFADSLRERELEMPELPPLPPRPEPEPETSFIAVRLVDQASNPVIGRAWTIELPDGSVHEGETDADGWARVAGFKQDGEAKVSFPDFDEVDFKSRGIKERVIVPVEGGDEDSRFMELTFLKPNGHPARGIAFNVTTADGTVFESVTDDHGFAKIIGLSGNAAQVSAIKRQA